MARRRLALLLQPLQHSDPIEIAAPGMLCADRPDGSRHGHFLGEVQKPERQEGPGEMERRRKHARAQDATASARLDEHELAIEPDVARDAQATVEIEKVGAAAEKDVLAIIDGLRVIGGGPSA